MVFLCLYKFK